MISFNRSSHASAPQTTINSYNHCMFRLTREVRFAINHEQGDLFSRPPANSYAGYPSLAGLGHYFILAATVAGELQPRSNYLLNIKDIDQQVRKRAIPIFEQVIRQRPRDFGAPLMNDVFDQLETAWP